MTPQTSSLDHTLTQELAAATRLQQVLQQEQELLIGADIGALEAVTADKNKLVAELTDLALQRQRHMTSAGIAQDAVGIQAWLSTASPATAKLWTDLLDTARASQSLNRTNGMLITQHQNRNQSALNVLRGASNSAGGLYGPDGQKAVGGGKRGLVVG
ncbi:flagella synthesis protein FlgN [Noviherbaspirillum humi]|uniref:Flagella synthesis protein FlgN n=1 Tax=Noviherbaspirillum humi TaxID=1688639 RepID=A0A239FWE7_9BURK|nr:flagellar protein FlgN [Noviherbaspirillum humi]SNS60838.1 flagella synthesis protein FlgN [Noviherbaspirillum humi]